MEKTNSFTSLRMWQKAHAFVLTVYLFCTSHTFCTKNYLFFPVFRLSTVLYVQYVHRRRIVSLNVKKNYIFTNYSYRNREIVFKLFFFFFLAAIFSHTKQHKHKFFQIIFTYVHLKTVKCVTRVNFFSVAVCEFVLRKFKIIFFCL